RRRGSRLIPGMAKPQRTPVGVIGLGIIGSRAVANLRKAGFQVWVWNRSPRAEPHFLSSPAEVAESASVVSLFVSDGPALIEVVTAMAPALTPSHTIVNHATVAPAEARQAAEIAAERHAKFLDAPFTGSRDAAAEGRLIFYAGGAPEALEAARPVLEAIGSKILPVGEVGEASALKVATNLLVAGSVAAYAEALALLSRTGIPLERLLEALDGHAVNSPLAGMKIPAMITGDFAPRFSLQNMFKDARIALKIAEECKVEMPVAAAFAGMAMAGLHQGWGGEDFSVIARHFGFPDPGNPLSAKYQPAPAAEAPEPATAKPERRGWRLFGR
ncbi:MAG: NAD(P)-dependent oxidoreductase, partial [Terrimicrobiaceae bacterium]|nr:NAD(P)-dependent oxidoreductase [Terrimicrobiaceae bacterium]